MRIIGITILILYTVFAVTTFLLSAQYWYAGLYFIVIAVVWFKLRKRLT